ncbi:flagellar biosynthesis protein FlhA [Solirubrobacter sp. CPCC 204708]|uniref:Flagellar biosynthesis protein FlhA n=1 Tax=Solirubrobacter deserti TaxID=2282478 RepID=A0ABT4RMK5_9ACTN|nr:flagellar biosynthesis protein FlhA [Solirubrobacter deserti]MBE2316911.1 flagellar biosynthesis protein FlhA [Solirubrobacter deserti]MDA0139742.1 flagellar biosynthesis protein FlhA [Solirubrobacter deserti]
MNSTLSKIGKKADLLAAGGVVLIVAMLIIPLPPLLIDFFITLNISAALMIVVATMYVPRALDFSSFPTILLLTTLFRLAINVSVTRLILLEGDAGHVVEAFGNFVVGGNIVVGLVIFLILIVIQFVVITNGAGRVAEVGARFTLDSMPGKQMAIDADLNTGQITDEEARKRRAEVAQEADFYGAMDGASKFVKGDAMAGILITGINLLGGIIIGVVQMGMPFAEAGHHFSLMSIGDGLCAQIPALLISVATGILVTRSEGSESDLGSTVSKQILDQRKAPLVAGVMVMLFGLVPGLPKLPFLVIGALFFAVGWSLRNKPNAREQEKLDKEAALAAGPDPAQAQLAAPRDAALDALALDPLELAIGFGLVPMVDTQAGGTLLARVGTIRRQIASELGMVIPPVRIRDDVSLDSHEYVMRVRGTEVARGGVMAGHHMAMNPGDAMGQLAGIPTTEPAFGLPAVWIPESGRAEAEALGWTVVDSESVVVTHLTEMIRAHASELLSRQETRQLLDQLKEFNEAVVTEVVPDVLSLGEVQRVLQSLLREGVSIRDLGSILEAIGDKARLTRDPAMLAEYARQALGRTITAPFLDHEGTLRVIALDPTLEQTMAESLVQTADGEFLAMDPNLAAMVVDSAAEQVELAIAQGGRPVLLCSARVRRHLRMLCEQRLPQMAVCSYNEIAPGIGVETTGVITASLQQQAVAA